MGRNRDRKPFLALSLRKKKEFPAEGKGNIS
jgi:hypothetical protein